jgi:hypothetical protein
MARCESAMADWVPGRKELHGAVTSSQLCGKSFTTSVWRRPLAS